MCNDVPDRKDIIRNPLLLYSQWFSGWFCVRTQNANTSLDKIELLTSAEASVKASDFMSSLKAELASNLENSKSENKAKVEQKKPLSLLQVNDVDFEFHEGVGYSLSDLESLRIQPLTEYALKHFYIKPKKVTEFCKTGSYADPSFYDGMKILS